MKIYYYLLDEHGERSTECFTKSELMAMNLPSYVKVVKIIEFLPESISGIYGGLERSSVANRHLFNLASLKRYLVFSPKIYFSKNKILIQNRVVPILGICVASYFAFFHFNWEIEHSKSVIIAELNKNIQSDSISKVKCKQDLKDLNESISNYRLEVDSFNRIIKENKALIDSIQNVLIEYQKKANETYNTAYSGGTAEVSSAAIMEMKRQMIEAARKNEYAKVQIDGFKKIISEQKDHSNLIHKTLDSLNIVTKIKQDKILNLRQPQVP